VYTYLRTINSGYVSELSSSKMINWLACIGGSGGIFYSKVRQGTPGSAVSNHYMERKIFMGWTMADYTLYKKPGPCIQVVLLKGHREIDNFKLSSMTFYGQITCFLQKDTWMRGPGYYTYIQRIGRMAWSANGLFWREFSVYLAIDPAVISSNIHTQ